MTATAEKKSVLVAFQGGGAYGARSAGIADYLLELVEQNKLDIQGISGVSAGAVVGSLLSYGMAGGGPKEARSALRNFWRDIGARGRFSAISNPLSPNLATGPWSDWMKHFWSPNGPNFLLETLNAHMPDATRWQKPEAIDVTVAATDMQSGEEVLFTKKNLTTKAIAASAAYPPFGPLVKIDGRTLCDGAFSSNPPLVELAKQNPGVQDIIIVRLNPERVPNAPATFSDFEFRRDQLLLNATLNREIEHLADTHPDVRIHIISFSPPPHWNESSKFNISENHLNGLYEGGRKDAAAWWAKYGHEIGVKNPAKRNVAKSSTHNKPTL